MSTKLKYADRSDVSIILYALRDQPKKAFSIKELVHIIEDRHLFGAGPDHSVRARLSELTNAGLIRRVGRGMYSAGSTTRHLF